MFFAVYSIFNRLFSMVSFLKNALVQLWLFDI